MDESLSLEESRELLALCKAGKLYQVEEWIRQGRTDLPADIHVAQLPSDIPRHIAQHVSHIPLLGARTVFREIVLQGCRNESQCSLDFQKVTALSVRRYG